MSSTMFVFLVAFLCVVNGLRPAVDDAAASSWEDEEEYSDDYYSEEEPTLSPCTDLVAQTGSEWEEVPTSRLHLERRTVQPDGHSGCYFMSTLETLRVNGYVASFFKEGYIKLEQSIEHTGKGRCMRWVNAKTQARGVWDDSAEKAKHASAHKYVVTESVTNDDEDEHTKHRHAPLWERALGSVLAAKYSRRKLHEWNVSPFSLFSKALTHATNSQKSGIVTEYLRRIDPAIGVQHITMSITPHSKKWTNLPESNRVSKAKGTFHAYSLDRTAINVHHNLAMDDLHFPCGGDTDCPGAFYGVFNQQSQGYRMDTWLVQPNTCHDECADYEGAAKCHSIHVYKLTNMPKDVDADYNSLYKVNAAAETQRDADQRSWMCAENRL